jgi:hypothetical protein
MSQTDTRDHMTAETHSRNHCCVGKLTGIGCSECVYVALVLQHATSMRLIILSFVACPAVPSPPPHYLINGTILGKTLLNIKCVFRFSLRYWSEIFLFLRKTERDITINVHMASCKVPENLCEILTNLKFPRQGFEQSWNIKFLENSSSGSRIVPREWTDRRDEPNSPFFAVLRTHLAKWRA